jgi:hypothetical protein
MGVYIRLEILPRQIDQGKWENAYEESLKLLKAYPFMTIAKQEVNDLERLVYTSKLEYDIDDEGRHWGVCGDLDTKKAGETFSLFSDLRHYTRNNTTHDEVQTDILAETNKDDSRTVYVFDSKTQGEDYHIYVLAIAMLLESRFPYSAIVRGDIDIHQAKKAQEWANQVLHNPLDLPVIVDAERLFDRLVAHFSGVELVEAFDRLYISDGCNIAPILIQKVDKQIIREWFVSRFEKYNLISPTQLGAIKLFIEWLNATRDIETLCKMACLDEDGPKFDVIQFVKALCSTWIMMPQEEFAFLKIFQNPQGQPTTVAGQFGQMFLDMQFQGRFIRCHVDKEEVTRILSIYFPQMIKDIVQVIDEEMETKKEALKLFQENLKPLLEVKNPESLEDSGDVYLYYDETTVLTEQQKLAPLIVVSQFFEVMNSPKYQGSLELFNDARRSIIYLTNRHNIALTETAWHWLDTETNREVFTVLLIILLVDEDAKWFVDMRRAMLENKLFCEKVAELMKDDEMIKKAKEYIKEHRKTTSLSK